MKSNKSEKFNITEQDAEQGREDKTEKKELSLEKIPKEARNVLEKLEEQGFEGYLVGGCVRDVLRDENPNDWDVVSNARPKDILRIFHHSFYENKFGTVTVVNETSDATLKNIEITSLRKEGKYTDKRHPDEDEIEFTETLEIDLGRRESTINAMAANIRNGKIEIIDLFNGRKDLEDKIIRAVGNPEHRFREDSFRMLRAARFAAVFGFDIEKDTKKAIQENAELLSAVGNREIKNEFLKIIESKNPTQGIKLLSELNLFSEIFPEIAKKFPKQDFSKEKFPLLEKSADTDSSAQARLALFFLDLKNIKDINEIELSEKSLRYLRIPNTDIKKIHALFRGNNTIKNFKKLDETTARRLWKSFALKHRIDDEVKKTMQDFITIQKIQQKDEQGRQAVKNKEKMISDTSKDPLFISDLKLRGGEIIKELKIKPSSKILKISEILLDKVIKDPEKNTKENLLSQAKELNQKIL